MLRITAKKPQKVKIEFPILPGYGVPIIRANGIEVTATPLTDSINCDIEIGDQPLDLTASYTSLLFNFSAEKLARFPFFTEASTPGFVVVTDSVTELEKLSNDIKLREFVSFYQTVVKGRESAEPLVITSKDSSGKAVLSIKFDPQASHPGIFMPKDGQIDIVAHDSAQLQTYLDRLLAVLDERYPYHPGFIGTWGMDPNLLRHVKMMGKNLDTP